MHIPPDSFDYPEGGSSAIIRVSFTGKIGAPEIPNTAFFVQLESALPVGAPLRIENGEWSSYEEAKVECWKIAEGLAKEL